ncbi:MerR family transcriptional regulator [Amycolatopsis cynarae]|uniref:MerR family transcriptional regulator n=1 Tax=Amycolatopsis cynarae TaxID=2995223 RepID=A0ABY7AY84_9PSEU|nr:MerR family transcriptional regulator [Amycolatopsis sp. HUAS 11-8]WAL64980.1 MerR family transcriptional regulator [Amycolatopsis sp. HUAS 11-8]
MRMAELSRESGVPVATIKYYLREGLLPPGERTSPNQARYGEEHVRRLRLVRALLEVGGLTVAAVREVVEAIDQRAPTHSLLGVIQCGLPVPKTEPDPEARAWALEKIEPVVRKHGWKGGPGDIVFEALVGAVAAFAHLERVELIERLDEYAALADRMAELDLAAIGSLTSTESIVEGAAIGTVLGDAMFTALRRLAQRRASAERFRD